jgi:3-oxoadipate enol-lactonase
MPFARAAGATIHYMVEGGGRDTVLLIMGLAGHATEWGEAFVADLASDHRVIRMDNRGIAQSQTSATSWTMEQMADDVRAVLDALALARVHVVGTSMGGMIAQTLALEHPERVDRLVLMATGFGGPEMIPAEPRAVAAFYPLPGESPGAQRRRGLKLLVGDSFAADHGPLLEMLVAQRERNPTAGPVFAAQYAAIVSSDRSQRVSGIKSRTLIVHGEQDPLVPVQNGRLLHERIPSSQLVLLEGVGHMPHLERPVESARAIREFLRAP